MKCFFRCTQVRNARSGARAPSNVVSTVVASFFVCVVRAKSVSSEGQVYKAVNVIISRSNIHPHATYWRACVVLVKHITSSSNISLANEYFHIRLRGELVAATALVAILSRSAESAAALGDRATRLSRRTVVVITTAKGAVTSNRAWVVPRCHLSKRSRTTALAEA